MSQTLALPNFRGSVSPWRHADLEWGLENVFDEKYADHLGGINRVAGSDVPVGARLPGWGRSLYLGVRLRL